MLKFVVTADIAGKDSTIYVGIYDSVADAVKDAREYKELPWVLHVTITVLFD